MTFPTSVGYGYDGYPGVPQLGIPANPYDGVYDRIFFGSTFILAQTGSTLGTANYTTRGAAEFSLSSIPANAAITSATFRYLESSDANNGVELYGYSGDGTVDLADMTRSGPLLSSSLTNGVFNINALNVDVTAMVQSLHASSASHLGLLFKPTLNTAQGNYTELFPQTLSVTYVVPEPATLAAVSFALPLVRRRRMCAE